MRKNASLILGLTLLLAMGATQAGAQSRLSPRRLLMAVIRQPETRLTDNDARQISRAILMRLQAASTEYIVVEAEEQWAGGDESGLSTIARAAQADCWLLVSLNGDWQAMTIGVRSYDLLADTLAVDLTLAREGWTSAHDLPSEAWDDLTQPVAAQYHASEAAAGKTALSVARLSVLARPGTVIQGLGDPLVIGEDGAGTRELPVLRQYTLRASLRGHGFVKRTVFLTADRVVTFAQAADPRWSLDASLKDRGHPGADLSWYFAPGMGFLRLGAMTCLLGLAFDDAEALSSDPLSAASVECGCYLTQEDADFSLYASFGGFLRVVHEAGAEPVMDALSPGGVTIIVGTEIPLSPRTRLFMEYTPTQYFTDVPALFRASLGADGNSGGWILSDTTALNLLSARVGLRWSP